MSVYCEFCGNKTNYMTAHQVARLLGVSVKTIYEYIKKNRFEGTVAIPGLTGPKTYRIPATAVLPLIERNEDELPSQLD